ncbi:hypothetical protein SeMB42_g07119 [Synchytrium endobioticum]|uniref:F-box domain-containing protein n=1 Tax=Synchytrium endobioticum TaxID=286115 RepID=A0A507C3F5_9FUNG|nr:hypothetical protein SeMB42_g07119 [Synchytrium endobioticum]TPX44317.1 hypothetical protein SeLEV6574_g04570 [Synchytrium endobioticum]
METNVKLEPTIYVDDVNLSSPSSARRTDMIRLLDLPQEVLWNCFIQTTPTTVYQKLPLVCKDMRNIIASRKPTALIELRVVDMSVDGAFAKLARFQFRKSFCARASLGPLRPAAVAVEISVSDLVVKAHLETLQGFLRPLLEQRARRQLLFEFASLALQAPLAADVVARIAENLKPNKVILPRWDKGTLEALPASMTYSLEIDEASPTFILTEKDVEVLTRFTNLTKLHLTNTKFKQLRNFVHESALVPLQRTKIKTLTVNSGSQVQGSVDALWKTISCITTLEHFDVSVFGTPHDTNVASQKTMYDLLKRMKKLVHARLPSVLTWEFWNSLPSYYAGDSLISDIKAASPEALLLKSLFIRLSNPSEEDLTVVVHSIARVFPCLESLSFWIKGGDVPSDVFLNMVSKLERQTQIHKVVYHLPEELHQRYSALPPLPASFRLRLELKS